MKIRIKNPIWGVPITFLGHYNPTQSQFEIIDMSTMSGVSANYWTMINGVPKYSRIFIKKKDDLTPIPTQFEIIDARAIALNDKQKNKSTYLIKDADGAINGKPTYARICIKKLS